jgi:serine/threonine protein kinase
MTGVQRTMNATDLNAALAGSYTIASEIGVGAFLTVYLARDDRNDRLVALKVLKPEISGVLVVERFLAEIRVTANLQHPNLVPLFDCGHADRTLYFVTPYVEGENLRRRLDREKQLPVDEAIRISAAVGRALDYAHRNGAIHRDLRPENILLKDGEVFVVDFGIALGIWNAGGAKLTQRGVSVAMPQYMSPEIATGDRTVDSRADIYSLAAITYEMLVGEPPHTGPTPHAIVSKLLTETAKPVRMSRPTVPEHTDAAVSRSLSRFPAERHATARDFVEGVTGRSLTPPRPMVMPQTRTMSPIRQALPWFGIALAGALGFLAGRLSGQ